MRATINKVLAPALLLSVCSVIGAVSVTNSTGKVYTFGDWSPRSSVTVQAPEGGVELVRVACDVAEGDPGKLRMSLVEVLYSSQSDEIWLGEPAPHYMVFDQKIWGVGCQGKALRIKKSERAGDAANSEGLVLDKLIERVVEHPRHGLWQGDVAAKSLDLTRIFGFGAVCGSGAKPRGTRVQVSSFRVEKSGVVFTMRSEAGHDLSLKLGSNMEILAAEKDGVPTPVLFDGLLPATRPAGFASLGECRVLTETGVLVALASHADYCRYDASGAEQSVASVRAVALSNGDLWIGPDQCRLVVVRDRLLGLQMSETGELLVYAGPCARIPGPPEGIAVFREVALGFEDRLKASEYQWHADLKVNLTSIVAGDARFPSDCAYWLGAGDGVSINDGNVVIKVSSSCSEAWVEITLAPDLRVVSSRVLNREPPGQL